MFPIGGTGKAILKRVVHDKQVIGFDDVKMGMTEAKKQDEINKIKSEMETEIAMRKSVDEMQQALIEEQKQKVRRMKSKHELRHY